MKIKKVCLATLAILTVTGSWAFASTNTNDDKTKHENSVSKNIPRGDKLQNPVIGPAIDLGSIFNTIKHSIDVTINRTQEIRDEADSHANRARDLVVGRTQEIRDEAITHANNIGRVMLENRDYLVLHTSNVRDDIFERIESNSSLVTGELSEVNNEINSIITYESERVLSQVNDGYNDLSGSITNESSKLASDVIKAKEDIQADITSLTTQIELLAEQGIGLGILNAEELTGMIDEVRRSRENFMQEINAFQDVKVQFIFDFSVFINSLSDITKQGLELGLMGTADIESLANVNISDLNSIISNLPDEVLYPLYRVLGNELSSWTSMNITISEAISTVASPLRAHNPFITSDLGVTRSLSNSSQSPFDKKMAFCDAHILSNFDELNEAVKIMEYYNTVSKIFASLLIKDVLKSADKSIYEYSIVKSFKLPQISKPGVWVVMQLLETTPKISGEITTKLRPLLNSCATNDHLRSTQEAQLQILTQMCNSMRNCNI